MSARPPSASTFVRLTPTQVLVMEHIAAGATNSEAAAALGLKQGTLEGHLRQIGNKTGVSSRPARVHAALNTGQAKPPSAPQERPDFSPDELLLLYAVAMRSSREEIATAAGGLPQSTVHPRIRNLVKKAGAKDAAHLIGLAHAWELLGSGPDRTTHADSASTGSGGRR
ncbi:helix-turn-helix transcriptional regulator [Streptomyces sp. NPDC049597]|uniref:helix-turn-helix transcriptional regulator n=1 Tax=Streptomyces sp. NPDC049597 TaxID=3155276 RepID=UPI00342242E8